MAERDWSLPCEWFAEAARCPHAPTAEYLESVAMGGVNGQYEYLRHDVEADA